MPAKTPFIVQQFDRVGKKLVAGRQMEQPSADAAQARAERDASRCACVVAIQQTIDTETGEVLEEPIVLAKFGELPAGMFEEERGGNDLTVNTGSASIIPVAFLSELPQPSHERSALSGGR